MKKLCLTLAILSSFLFANSNDLYVILDDKLLKPMAEFQNSGDKNKAEEFYQNLISEISKIPSARDKRFVANEFFDLLRSEKKLHNIKINLGELILKGLTPASLDDENLLIEMHKIADEHYESFDIKNKKEKQEALIRRAQIEEQLINLCANLADHTKAQRWYSRWNESFKDIRRYDLLISFAQKNAYYESMVDNIKRLNQLISNYNNSNNSELHTKSLGHHFLTAFTYAETSLLFLNKTADKEIIEIAKITCKYNNFKKPFDEASLIGSSTTQLPAYAKILHLEQMPQYANSSSFIKKAIASQSGSEKLLDEIISKEMSDIKSNATITNEEFFKLLTWAINDRNIQNKKNQYFFLKHLENGFTMIDSKNPKFTEMKNQFDTAVKNLAIVNKIEGKRNPPAPEPDIDPRVITWLATEKNERERIKNQVINQLQQANPNKIVNVRIDVDRLQLNIDNSSDFTNAKALTQIPFKQIFMNHTKTIDHSFLSEMPLQTLYAEWSSFSELGHIQNIKSLRRLRINGTDIKSLAKLKNLTLTHLAVNHVKIPNIDTLEGMPLEELEMSNTNVSSLKPIAFAPLTYLNASNCKELRDISALEHTDLKRLNLQNSDKVPNLIPISNLLLTDLNIENTIIPDLAPIVKMPLENLYFARNQRIRSIVPLQWMEIKRLSINNALMLPTIIRYNFPLQSLGLPETNISDLTILKAFDQVKHLDISDCLYVKDLRPLKLMKITELNITNCKSLKTFKGVDETEITRLIANGTTLRDLTSLVGSKVNDLRLRFSEIISLSGIEKMEVLTLDVRQCLKLKDISALEGSSIRDLTIRGTTPTDLTPINKMPHLRSTDIKP